MTNRFILLATLLCCFFTWDSHGQSSNSSVLQLRPETAHQLEVSQQNSVYSITTTGVDPYIFSTPLMADLPEGNSVLEFEYFAPKYLDNLQVFFGPPIVADGLANSELGVREGWTPHAVPLPDHLKGWGKKGQFIRLDFGGSAGYTIQLRNLRFRKPNANELRLIKEREAIKQRELESVAQLQKYLQNDFPNEVTHISATQEEIIIQGKVTEKNATWFLKEVPLYQDLYAMKEFTNLIPLTITNNTFEKRVKRAKALAQGNDPLLSKWALVKKVGAKMELASHGRYVDEIAPLTSFPNEPLRGKKGIGGFNVGRREIGDVDSLGITSVTVNMWITQMIRSTPSPNHIPFEYNGKTYYAVKKWVDNMDATLRFCAEKKLIVSSIILIEKAVNVPDTTIGRVFEHPDCDPSGIYSMANLTSAEGTEYYAAAIDFLAKRYNRDDNAYGRIHHWIAHNEVDAGWVWTNMGDKHPQLFMDTYVKSMRLLHSIARQYNPYTKTFISLTHFWAWTEDRHFYHSDELLEMMLTYSAKEGDFEWAIAHHPYPESLFEPKSWLDTKATFSMKTPIISFKNLEVLDAWVKQPKALYKGKTRRTVFLSEQGPNSRDYSEKHLIEQAAGMAYAWKKMDRLDGIDAFQYHNWFDDRSEGGLRIGLRRFVDDEEAPSDKKPVWYVFRDIGTEKEEAGTEFAKKIIGIKDWTEVFYKGVIQDK